MKFLNSLLLATVLMLPAGIAYAAGSNTGTNYRTNGVETIGGTLTIPGTLKLNGNTIAAASGTATITVPNTTGTLALRDNQTPVACGATCTLGAANSGTITKFDTAAGSVGTLPAALGTGAKYNMVITTATTSAADKVLLTTVTDTIIGTAQGENAGTAKVFVGNASTYHSIQMPFAGTQPSGGFIGDEINCTDIAATIWFCNVKYQAGTAPTTPYSASTS